MSRHHSDDASTSKRFRVTEKDKLLTPLAVAAKLGHIAAIELLLEYGADLNKVTTHNPHRTVVFDVTVLGSALVARI